MNPEADFAEKVWKTNFWPLVKVNIVNVWYFFEGGCGGCRKFVFSLVIADHFLTSPGRDP